MKNVDVSISSDKESIIQYSNNAIGNEARTTKNDIYLRGSNYIRSIDLWNVQLFLPNSAVFCVLLERAVTIRIRYLRTNKKLLCIIQ